MLMEKLGSKEGVLEAQARSVSRAPTLSSEDTVLICGAFPPTHPHPPHIVRDTGLAVSGDDSFLLFAERAQ